MAHKTLKLTNVKPKKNVVRFDYYADDVEREDQKPVLVSSIYVHKDKAKEELGVKNLAKVAGVEVTIRIIKE